MCPSHVLLPYVSYDKVFSTIHVRGKTTKEKLGRNADHSTIDIKH
jgi:hypothetical protein